MSQVLQLSREERALFNPAFMAVVCCRVVQGHAQKHTPSCPLALVITAAVMALQPAIRAALPSKTSASLAKWAEENHSVRVTMAANASSLSSVVRPGMQFALQTGILQLDDAARLELRSGAIPATIRGVSSNVIAIQKAAHMLGRWLPTAGRTSTTMSLLGVRP